MGCSVPGFPVLPYLPEFAQTPVHWVDDAIQPSYPLLPPSHPALNLSQHRGLFQWVSSWHQVAKVLELQLQQQTYQWIQCQTLLLTLDTTTVEHHFCFSPATSFYLVLVIALCSSPVAYWTPSDLGSSSSGVLSLGFCIFFMFVGFSQQEYCSGFSFLPPRDHVLSELSTRTHPS